MKRIFALVSIIALVFSLGILLDYMINADVSLVSDMLPAISIGGAE